MLKDFKEGTFKAKEFPKKVQGYFHELITLSRSSTYAPYSNFGVCALIIDSEETKFFGVNCETANYDSSCAEAGSVMNYVLGGRKGIKLIIIYGAPLKSEAISGHFSTPCGRCRQRLYEHAKSDTRIVCLDQSGENVLVFKMETLLPKAFGPEDLGLSK
ncbi:MAG: cytidine deaminase [Deltaproteobacteria bacterium]